MRRELQDQSFFAEMEAIVSAARSGNLEPSSALPTNFIEQALRVAEARRLRRRITLGTAAIVLFAGMLSATASMHSKVTTVSIAPRYAVQPPQIHTELKSQQPPKPIVRLAVSTPNQIHIHTAPHKRLMQASHRVHYAVRTNGEAAHNTPIWTTSVVQTRETGVVVPVSPVGGTQGNGQVTLAVVPLQRENNQFQLANYENR